MHKDLRLMKEILISLMQLRDELPVLMGGQEAIYFPDFNLLYPYVYRQTEKRYHYTDALGTCLFTLNSNMIKPPHVHICLSLPTTIEFIFSLERHHHSFRNHLADSESAKYTFQCLTDLEAGRINIRDIKSEPVKQFILTIHQFSGIDTTMANFLRSVSESKVDMLTDYYSSSTINALLADNRSMLERIRATMEPEREKDDERAEINKVVSYKVDAHNIFLPILNTVDNGKVVNFVCSGRFYRWAPDVRLRRYQRSPLFLVMLMGQVGRLPSVDNAATLSDIEPFVREQIEHGALLIKYAEDYNILPLDIQRRIDLYVYTNYHAYINMAKSISSTSEEAADARRGEPSSYADYLDMIDGRSRKVAKTVHEVHGLIDDRRDDMYRDFVDDERIRKALSSLKLG